MLNNPIILVLWTLAPAAIVFGFSYLLKRYSSSTTLFRDQPWGCRAVALVLVFAQSDLLVLLWTLGSVDLAMKLTAVWPWHFEGLLLSLQLIQVTPVVLLVRRCPPPFLRRVGLLRDRAVSVGASATAGFFLLVFLDSVLRGYSSRGWNGLYMNPTFGADFYRLPLSHGLALPAVKAIAGSVEEVIFRGFALLPIARALGPLGGIAATSLFWGMAHLSVARTIGLFPLGLLLGWMFYRTRSLVPSLSFHILWNLASDSDLVFGRLRAAGMHWTSAQHFLYIGGGSLCVALLCAVVALITGRTDKAGSRLSQ